MPDEIDRAQKRTQELQDIALEEHARRRGVDLPPCGECYGCGEPFRLGDQRLFCNGACADDFARQQRQRAANGE